MQAGDVASLMAAGRAALGADKFLGTGCRLFYLEMASPEVLAAKVKPALAPGVDGIVSIITASFPPRGSTGSVLFGSLEPVGQCSSAMNLKSSWK